MHPGRAHQPGLIRLVLAAICLLAMSFAPLVHAWSHPSEAAERLHESTGCSAGGCGDSPYHDDQSDHPADESDRPTDQTPAPAHAHHACDICIALHTPGGSGLDLAGPNFAHDFADRAVVRVLRAPPRITSGPVLFTCGPPTLG